MACFNFIDYFLELHSCYESPTSFFRWSAIGALSAILRDNVFYDVKGHCIYPNVYILINGPSAVRKTTPLKKALEIVLEINNTKVINGRSTMQAVVKKLSEAGTDANGRIIAGASSFLYTEELSSFLVADPATITLLTNLYDFHKNWRSETVGGGSIELKNVCITFLSASNDVHLRSVYDDTAIRGGLLGRTLMISEDKPRKKNIMVSEEVDDNEVVLSNKPLLEHARRISKLKGNVRMDLPAQREITSWYEDYDPFLEDRIGYNGRIDTHAKKISILLASARCDFDLVIQKPDIEEAIELVVGLKRNYKKFLAGVGMSNIAAQSSIVFREIYKAKDHHISRKVLFRNLLGDIDSETMINVITTLIDGGLLIDKSIGLEVGYQLTNEAVKMLEGKE